jgi:hypothetical protein
LGIYLLLVLSYFPEEFELKTGHLDLKVVEVLETDQEGLQAEGVAVLLTILFPVY